jgi:hypothetical protein
MSSFLDFKVQLIGKTNGSHHAQWIIGVGDIWARGVFNTLFSMSFRPSNGLAVLESI